MVIFPCRLLPALFQRNQPVQPPLRPLKQFPHLFHGLPYGVNLKAMMWAGEVVPHLSKE